MLTKTPIEEVTPGMIFSVMGDKCEILSVRRTAPLPYRDDARRGNGFEITYTRQGEEWSTELWQGESVWID